MAEISFSIAALFEKTFGYKTKAFDPKPTAIKGNGGKQSISRTEYSAQGSEYYATDALGREYFMPVKIVYADDNGAGDDADKQLKEWQLPYPVISISSSKTIVETTLTERRGTVKELINIQDYEIVIKGFMIGSGNEFPEEAITTLRSIYEKNLSVSIECPVTDIFLLRPDRGGSDKVVIKNLKFPAVAGVKHVRPYELTLVSDEPFNLISITD